MRGQCNYWVLYLFSLNSVLWLYPTTISNKINNLHLHIISRICIEHIPSDIKPACALGKTDHYFITITVAPEEFNGKTTHL